MKKLIIIGLTLSLLFCVYLHTDDNVSRIKVKNNTDYAIDTHFFYSNQNDSSYYIVLNPQEIRYFNLKLLFDDIYFEYAQIQVAYDSSATTNYLLKNHFDDLYEVIQNTYIKASDKISVCNSKSYVINIENNKFIITQENNKP